MEQDAEAEAPTTARPTSFMVDQFKRATITPTSYASIEESGGLFPWKTLDWIGWIKHPEQWLIGLKLAYAFEAITRASANERQLKVQGIAAQCKRNEQYYDRLNEKLDGKLILPGQGSIIVARNEQEVSELKAMQQNLAKEGRELTLLTREEMIARYGHAPAGLLYAEKAHDRSLSPHFMPLLTAYIRKNGGQVMDGTLTTVYVDTTKTGGLAEYRTPEGNVQYLPFSRLVMSLGSQKIVDEHDESLFDTVAARGVSVLAHVKVPKGERLPALIVCGGTNHVTTLDKKEMADHDLYLVRMTAGACITPNISTEDSANYDGTIALGLVTSVRKTLGYEVTPVAVYGCNRQVSQYGQTSWITPAPGVHIQYGAGGGGLTRAPDLVATADRDEPSDTATVSIRR